ncbi:hypothetical protein KC669_00155 [Candidatus Dojkabacteria bacterium]|uniref:Uncharacterized protein n=1 Tax=Candidatus Dojkabacteria bacterium TaxID=2099670 RepID=A0A955RLL0_9BACT|nr:hypothetical protein [Candidatus Dojkabacteria bacterium]
MQNTPESTLYDLPSSIQLGNEHYTVTYNEDPEEVIKGVTCITLELNEISEIADGAIVEVQKGYHTPIQEVGHSFIAIEQPYTGSGHLLFMRNGETNVNYHYFNTENNISCPPLFLEPGSLLCWVASSSKDHNLVFAEIITPRFKAGETFKEGSEIDPVRFKLMKNAINQLLRIEA